LFLDGLRRGRREVQVADDRDPDGGPSPGVSAEDVVHAREFAAQIERVLAGLPSSQRTAFELIKYHDLSVADAAHVLGTTVAAVKLRAHRAYEALRFALGDAVGDLEKGER
jgi:RNA polymerase sigma-70 factor (ECF subfamily)